MLDATSTILVIDDDVDLRNSLGRLLRSVGLNAKLFASVSDFLKSEPTEGPSCLVLDVRLPGQSGLEFQRELAAAGTALPSIFFTGHGDIATSLQGTKNSALAYLRQRFATLSPREREIMRHVARGRLSKQIAGDIGIAEATVKVHRSKAMRKINARSLPEFGQMVAKLNLMPEKSQRS